MSNESSVEKQFSENIDHLLAGEKVMIDKDVENDAQRATDFAQKMIALRTEPSANFRANLKARLLRKLGEVEAERQAKQEQSWFRRLLPHPRVWQLAMVALFIVAIGGTIWGVLRPDVAPLEEPGIFLKVEANTNKTSYKPGEQVKIKVSLKNVTSEPLQIEQLPPLLSLMQAESKQPVYTFVEKREARTLAPGEIVEFAIVWNQRDDRGKYVASGRYYIELEDLEYHGQSMRLSLAMPASFNIH